MANKGTDFEREIKQIFEAAGYSVMRGAASKGEFFGMKVDLIISKETGQNTKTAYVAGIQCKVKGKKKEKDNE